jgi:hypothetical protein
MAKKRIHVRKEGEGYVVDPGVLELQGKVDRVRLVNHTEQKATWTVPGGVFEGGPVNEDVGYQDFSNEYKVKSHTQPKYYTYQVKLTPSGQMAHGNSDPVIIIED